MEGRIIFTCKRVKYSYMNEKLKTNVESLLDLFIFLTNLLCTYFAFIQASLFSLNVLFYNSFLGLFFPYYNFKLKH